MHSVQSVVSIFLFRIKIGRGVALPQLEGIEPARRLDRIAVEHEVLNLRQIILERKMNLVIRVARTTDYTDYFY